jgi:hypothetical protein
LLQNIENANFHFEFSKVISNKKPQTQQIFEFGTFYDKENKFIDEPLIVLKARLLNKDTKMNAKSYWGLLQEMKKPSVCWVSSRLFR